MARTICRASWTALFSTFKLKIPVESPFLVKSEYKNISFNNTVPLVVFCLDMNADYISWVITTQKATVSLERNMMYWIITYAQLTAPKWQVWGILIIK